MVVSKNSACCFCHPVDWTHAVASSFAEVAKCCWLPKVWNCMGLPEEFLLRVVVS